MLDLDGKWLCAGFTGILAARATPRILTWKPDGWG